MSAENVFVVDPFNTPFVGGEAKHPPDYLIGVVFAVIVLFVLPMIALNMLVIEAVTDPDTAITGSLTLVVTVMLSINAILLGAAWWFWKRFSLKRNGALIHGEVVKVTGDVRPGSFGKEFVVTVWYTFTSPRSGRTFKGTIAQTRDDLTAETLPDVGAPVVVLYLNDRNYRVM